MDMLDIYSDGERPERCTNCNHVRTTVFRSVYGTEHIEYECMRRPEFIHRTQGEARCNYWTDVSLQGMVASAMNECLPEGMEYGPTLAELIERPVCRNIADYTKESFRCSECGCRVLVPGDRPDGVLVVTSEAFPVDWYSCPVCGAVVLDG